ncbi:MAG: opioid growth factor receptor-related protein [Pseudomonadota bacterium]|nr:opioid growth factor receptor-related protein [Pseudomonadota bacterium]
MSRLQAFLTGAGRDDAGRTVPEVLAFDDDALERRHDFIQWLFPLPEPSRAVPGSPVLTPADIAALKASPSAQANLQAAAERMLAFYASTRAWLRPADHNHLRITRIIRSLRLLVGPCEADRFKGGVMDLARARGAEINPTTLRFWAEA